MTEPAASDALAWHPLARLPDEWRAWLKTEGEAPFRADQVFRWIHRQGELSPSNMSNLALPLRERLAAQGLRAPGSVVDVKRAQDGTRKLLVEFEKGARVECVIIPMTPKTAEDTAYLVDPEGDPEDDEPPSQAPESHTKVTLCISTQYGCAMGCVFCASGQFGLQRGLGAHEIVFQVLLARRYLEPGELLSNLVFMGMGEPLHHYDETARAVRLITHPEGIGMSTRRLTVSTVGLPSGIQKLGDDFAGKVGLAVSLHAPDDETRSRIIPMNQRYPVAKLLAALKAYPLPRRRRITIEYTLIAGVNDSVEHAERLADLLRGLKVKVNLIPMNPIEASSLAAPSDAVVSRFRETLTERGYSCFVRTRRGDDVLAACGQLALQGEAATQGAVRLRRGKTDGV
ncbi:MAG TPA: 23S rRNA (adenine(2503)-C(2))-methyltransferase RlmN [Polyangiaceae bacterium]|nr:23S rRNA (adenine(2503)-C(2))-methyltransferase RlmN [Polyangiaceae bacterium]